MSAHNSPKPAQPRSTGKGDPSRTLLATNGPHLGNTLLWHQPEPLLTHPQTPDSWAALERGSHHMHITQAFLLSLWARDSAPYQETLRQLGRTDKGVSTTAWSLFFPIGLRLPSTDSHKVALARWILPQPGLSWGSALRFPQAGWSGLRGPAGEVFLIFTRQRFPSFSQRYQVKPNLEKHEEGATGAPRAPDKPSRSKQQHQTASALKMK